MTDDKELRALQEAIRWLHGAHSEHRESVPIAETFDGETAWDGVVEVFQLLNHPSSRLVYAWSHRTDTGRRRYVAVLHAPPVDSPRKAVQAAIVWQHFAEKAARSETN